MSLLEKIRKAHGPKTFTVEIPEWSENDEPLQVPARRFGAQDYIELSNRKPEEDEDRETFECMVFVIQRSLINEDGSQLLDDDDLYLLRDNPTLVARVGKELFERNKLGKDRPKNSASSP